MGRKYRDWVRAHSTAKRSARAVLNVLADYAKDEDGTTFPGYTTIARDTGLSERTIMRCINSLIEDGHLARVECVTGRGNKQGLKIITEKGDKLTSIQEAKEGSEKGDNGAQKGDNCAKRVTNTTEKGDNGDNDTIYGTVLEPDLEPRENRACVDPPATLTQPPAPTPALAQADVDKFVKDTNVPAHAPSPTSGAPPSRIVLTDPPSGPPQARQFDPRQLDAGGLWPEGTGQTPYEIYRESFATIPSRYQIKHMNANVTDLGRWREVTKKCALKDFRSYDNVFDVYQNGFRQEKKAYDNRKQPTTRPEPAHARPDLYEQFGWGATASA